METEIPNIDSTNINTSNIDDKNNYIHILNNITEFVDQKEYTEALYNIDIYLNDDKLKLPMNIKFALNYIAGIICQNNMDDFDMSLPYYMKTYSEFGRIEGLLSVVKYYNNMKRTILAYSLSIVCLFTKEIPDINCDKFIYDYERYYVHSLISLNMHKYGECIENIKKCIEYLQPEMKEFSENMESCKAIFEKANDLLLKESSINKK